MSWYVCLFLCFDFQHAFPQEPKSGDSEAVTFPGVELFVQAYATDRLVEASSRKKNFQYH